jgi:hypothetical protein
MEKIRFRLFTGIFVVAIIFAMVGWVFALGWTAFKLFQFVV